MEPGGFDIQRIFQAAQQVQAQFQNAQQALADSEVTGTAGGGAVRAVVSGAGELLDVTIDPGVIDPADQEETAATVADLVLAAVRDASRAVAELQERQLGALGGSVPPGFDLSSFGLPGAVPGQVDDEDDEDDLDDDEEER